MILTYKKSVKSSSNDEESTSFDTKFVNDLMDRGFKPFVTNFKTKHLSVNVGGHRLICTLNNEEYDNSPMCSPYNLFCRYPKKRIHVIKNLLLRKFLDVVTSFFSVTFKGTKIDRVIQVNNKPCDAIVYPDASSSEIKACLNLLLEKFPKHSIIFPRLDNVSSPTIFKSLENSGFLMVPTRAVHIFDPATNYQKRSHTKRDFSFLRKSDYEVVGHDEISKDDLERIHELYQMLFIEKHSRANPDLTLEFFKKSHHNRWYTFSALRNKEGVIDAFYSFEELSQSMACGPLGYDTELPKERGLYRMIFAIALQIASDKRSILNFGGANDIFKMNRGSKKVIGYTAVYCKHLPLYRRLPWLFLAKAGQIFTVRILKKANF